MINDFINSKKPDTLPLHFTFEYVEGESLFLGH